MYIYIVYEISYAHGMAGNQADTWGFSHLKPPKSQPTLIESSQVEVPPCFSIRRL